MSSSLTVRFKSKDYNWEFPPLPMNPTITIKYKVIKFDTDSREAAADVAIQASFLRDTTTGTYAGIVDERCRINAAVAQCQKQDSKTVSFTTKNISEDQPITLYQSYLFAMGYHGGPGQTNAYAELVIEEVKITFNENPPNNDNPPIASFNYGPTEPQAGELVTFVSTSQDPDNELLAYTWTIEDISNGTILKTSTEESFS